jgi:hypothetical protein
MKPLALIAVHALQLARFRPLASKKLTQHSGGAAEIFASPPFLQFTQHNYQAA